MFYGGNDNLNKPSEEIQRIMINALTQGGYDKVLFLILNTYIIKYRKRLIML